LKISDYQNYSAEELAADPDFRQWCLGAAADNRWSELPLRHPDCADTIIEARRLVLGVALHFEKHRIGPESLDAKYQQTISAARRKTRVIKIKRRKRVLGIAAAILLMCTATAIFLTLDLFPSATAPPLVYQTGFGEQRVIELPDGSAVRLNANSQLRLSENWRATADKREVWLEGEAYFSVERKFVSGAKFVVHVGDLDVEVLGTQFNVDSRTDATEVVLDEGKIRLVNTGDSTDYTMVPGEVVRINRKHVTFNKVADADPETYHSWKDGYLLYKDAELSEVLRDVKSTFGYQPLVRDSSVLSGSITGALPATDLDEFLTVLKDIMPNVNFLKKGKELVVTKAE